MQYKIYVIYFAYKFTDTTKLTWSFSYIYNKWNAEFQFEVS